MTAPVAASPSSLGPPVDEEAWRRRFRLARSTLPASAKHDPEHLALQSNATGVIEAYAWDRRAGTLRQVTDRPAGTFHSAIDAPGTSIWWFADTDGDEVGVWMRQPFTGGPDVPALALPPAWPAGLAMAWDGRVLVGRWDDDTGATVHLTDGRGHDQLVARGDEPLYAVDVSRDGRLVVVELDPETEDGDPAVRVVRTDGSVVLELPADDGGHEAVGFAPDGSGRLLVRRRRAGRWAPVLVDLGTGEQVELDLGLPGDAEVSWQPDGCGLLVRHHRHGRTDLGRHDLRTGRTMPIPTPPGTVSAARCRPNGTVWYLWSDAATPPTLRSTGAPAGLVFPGPPAPPSVPVDDAWVDGPGGRVHALVSRPAGAAGATPAVLLLHGGPADHDTDEYDATVAAWVDHGFTVVRVNYRGSTGYGADWARAARACPGHTELEDVLAVRAWVVARGLVDPDRVVVAGASWGGYLALLAVGAQPDGWCCAIADAPIADFAAAYAESNQAVRADLRARFGGSPDAVPGRYAVASPITFVDRVSVPVLVSAAINDARCPIGQVEPYAEALAARGIPHEFVRTDDGHHSADVDAAIDLVARQLAFARRHLNPDHP